MNILDVIEKRKEIEEYWKKVEQKQGHPLTKKQQSDRNWDLKMNDGSTYLGMKILKKDDE